MHILLFAILLFVGFHLPSESLFNGVKLSQLVMRKRLSSTDKLTNASSMLNVPSPWNAPSWIWRWAWKLHHTAIPLLHAFDRCQTRESFVNLPVLWWKAISGNRKHSIGYDHGFAYDLLPGVTRAVVSYPLCYLYPPLHHQNVLLRTVYLDQCLQKLLHETYAAMSLDVHVITFGAGFDTRCLRLLNDCFAPASSSSSPDCRFERNISCYEYDLPSVVSQKRAMFDRLSKRRAGKHLSRNSNLEGVKLPELDSVDLNDPMQLDNRLSALLSSPRLVQSKAAHKQVFVVFVEAVFLYLLPHKATACLDVISKLFCQYVDHQKRSGGGDVDVYFCFADRLAFDENAVDVAGIKNEEYTRDEEETRMKEYLRTLRFDLINYLPKPGKARHMGVAKLMC